MFLKENLLTKSFVRFNLTKREKLRIKFILLTIITIFFLIIIIIFILKIRIQPLYHCIQHILFLNNLSIRKMGHILLSYSLLQQLSKFLSLPILFIVPLDPKTGHKLQLPHSFLPSFLYKFINYSSSLRPNIQHLLILLKLLFALITSLYFFSCPIFS